MADIERSVLDFYQISNPFPDQWPPERNNTSDVSDDEADRKRKASRRKSRYQALEKAVSARNSIVPGADPSGTGVGNLVQRDEPDPLGTTDSVVRTLKQLGVPLQDDIRLRNRFLLSSTTFSPALFLSQMHATADTRSLLDGLEVLSQSIDRKSASLKILVESNFERFVKAKATIDNVYKEMKYHGADATPPPARARAHSRHASRNSFRSSSGGLALASPLTPAALDPRKKNALIKESEYGVLGIKQPLLEVSAKAEDVWGPALGGRDKEEHLKTVASTLETYQDYVDMSAAIADSIRRKDHESLVEEYTRARKFADEAAAIAKNLAAAQPDDTQLYKIIVAVRMWHDVNEQISAFKRDLWRRLISLNNIAKSDSPPGAPQDQHMDLINLLLELGVEDNPIWAWLSSRHDYLKGKVQAVAERAKVEIEVLRRRLANLDKPSPAAVASHMRSLGRLSVESKPVNFDSADVLELWEKMALFVSSLLSPQGILGEVVEFWQTVQGFIEGKTQRTLPVGYENESERHHHLSQQGKLDLKRGMLELVDALRDHLQAFFVGPPPEDISLLFSPMLPPSPATPNMARLSGSLSIANLDPRFQLEPGNLPPPSPKRSEAWERFAFWPPWSNSVSGVHYLAKMLALVGSGAADMASLSPVGRGDLDGAAAVLEGLRNLVGSARERCVQALCAAWNLDAENIKFVEDWNRSPDRRDVTKMPACFAAFEGTVLGGMQKILYIPEAMSRPSAEDIVPPPPPKVLMMVRSQYVTTLYKALSGMVENAQRPTKTADDDWTTDMEGFVALNGATDGKASTAGGGTVNVGDRNVRMLLTLSNLQLLRAESVPQLNTQFENAFSVKLTEESTKIRDVLSQIDARLFQSYTRHATESLRTVIRAGIAAPDWAPAPGSDNKALSVRPYVYDALLGLVLVHTQVSTTTSSSLTSQVLSYLLEQACREMLEAFRERGARYSLEALMQATLDVEFAAQTLSHYTTPQASELQSQIYQELDARTDNDARTHLQNELHEMRAVLKRLREASKGEFSCFRKPKRHHGAAAHHHASSSSTSTLLGAEHKREANQSTGST